MPLTFPRTIQKEDRTSGYSEPKIDIEKIVSESIDAYDSMIFDEISKKLEELVKFYKSQSQSLMEDGNIKDLENFKLFDELRKEIQILNEQQEDIYRELKEIKNKKIDFPPFPDFPEIPPYPEMPKFPEVLPYPEIPPYPDFPEIPDYSEKLNKISIEIYKINQKIDDKIDEIEYPDLESMKQEIVSKTKELISNQKIIDHSKEISELKNKIDENQKSNDSKLCQIFDYLPKLKTETDFSPLIQMIANLSNSTNNQKEIFEKNRNEQIQWLKQQSIKMSKIQSKFIWFQISIAILFATEIILKFI